jgi:hypothetical protein
MSDRFSSCTRRGPCLSPERLQPPHPHPRPLERFSSRERHTWAPPRHQTSRYSSLGGASCQIWRPGLCACLLVRLRGSVRESRCAFPSEHMGLTTGWRCLRKQAAAPRKELWTPAYSRAERAGSYDLDVVCWMPAQVRHDRRFQIKSISQDTPN